MGYKVTHDIAHRCVDGTARREGRLCFGLSDGDSLVLSGWSLVEHVAVAGLALSAMAVCQRQGSTSKSPGNESGRQPVESQEPGDPRLQIVSSSDSLSTPAKQVEALLLVRRTEQLRIPRRFILQQRIIRRRHGESRDAFFGRCALI